jgi:ribosomal protein S18 acetylase RimI-like enzyme
MSEVTLPTYTVLSVKASELPEAYRPLIYSKWLRSLRFGNELFKKVDSDEYYANYQKYLENLMAKPDSLVRLAVLTDDKDVVLGFSVSREDVLDYVHVHTDHRRQGIGKAVLPKHFTTFTHLTFTATGIWRKNMKYRQLKFNPFA